MRFLNICEKLRITCNTVYLYQWCLPHHGLRNEEVTEGRGVCCNDTESFLGTFREEGHLQASFLNIVVSIALQNSAEEVGVEVIDDGGHVLNYIQKGIEHNLKAWVTGCPALLCNGRLYSNHLHHCQLPRHMLGLENCSRPEHCHGKTLTCPSWNVHLWIIVLFEDNLLKDIIVIIQ